MKKVLVVCFVMFFLFVAYSHRFLDSNFSVWTTIHKDYESAGSVGLNLYEMKKDAGKFVRVERVVDGDTFIADIDGVQEKIRLIGLDTPEIIDPRRRVKCFGHEASIKAKEILENMHVQLEADLTQGDRDKYGRLLRYAFLSDDTMFNKFMIEEGYGFEYTYNLPYLYQSEFKDAMLRARAAKKGLWGNGVCR